MFAFKESSNQPNNYSLSDIAIKSGFKFRDIENFGTDWKTFGCVDVNKVIENQDFEFLEKITPKIIEAPMKSILRTAAIDPAVSSLFRLAQLSLQYMTFCQQFMSHTLYDLRKAFNHIQKKHSNLKYNFKCLEEQHYKAQERIESLLKEIQSQQNVKGDHILSLNSTPSSLYPCDQCTKNFLTLESLKSHQHRKHSVIEEKHELSDDNEKQNDRSDKDDLAKDVGENTQEMQPAHSDTADSQKGTFPSNINNNNDDESNANCTVCAQKNKINSSSIAIQCEVNDGLQQNFDEFKLKSDQTNDDEKCKETHIDSTKNDNKFDYYETMNELKKEIVELKNSLEAKSNETQQITLNEDQLTLKQSNSIHTSDKIDVIEQKFNAFETMYMESQHQFIESFRNLDERQQVYMNNIQETIKEIIEKSMGEHIALHEALPKDEAANQNNLHENCTVKISHTDKNEQTSETLHHKPLDEQLMETQQQKIHAELTYETSSHSEGEQSKTICQAEVYTHFQSDLIKSDEMRSKNDRKSINASKSQITKDNAMLEFEQRLRQFGVDADSAGLPTPRSNEVAQDLAEERKEMKKTHRSFEITRKKLTNKVDRIAKEKLLSASSMTSLSSISQQSDEHLPDEDEGVTRMVKVRPKSASVQKMRTRNAKKLMKKFVENDIDENDIIDKMQMAQEAINSHRECIQQLLDTTAHSPSSFTKLKYASTNGTKPNEKHNSNGEYSEPSINQYNKMPNVTTRRVVFVNLDEDS